MARASAKSKKADSGLRTITVNINGVDYRRAVEPRLLLVHFIRDVAGLTGTHVGCETSNCGACTVRLQRQVDKVLHGARGPGRRRPGGDDRRAHPRRCAPPHPAGLLGQPGLQCGFCTPGMIMQAYWMLKENPNPTDDEIKLGLSGNLCRCTGYQNIITSIRAAAKEMRKSGRLSAEGVGHRRLVRPRVFRHVDVAVGGAADVAAEIVLFAQQLATEIARNHIDSSRARSGFRSSFHKE